MNRTTNNNPLKWYSSDIQNDSTIIRHLSSNEIRGINRALKQLTNNNTDISTNNHFLFDEIKPLHDGIMQALVHMRGFIIIKGFPSLQNECGLENIKKLFLSFCTPLGTPLKQNKNHDVIFDVKSIDGMTLDTRDSRGPYVKESLPMHTDAGAILGMYCLSAADIGGATLLASAHTIHDVIKEQRPDLLEILYQPFYTDRRGNEPEGSLPYDLNPIFAKYGNQLRCQYHQPFYLDAQKKIADIPRLTPLQLEALEVFDQIALQTNIAFETKLDPGSIIFINNEEILHGRKTFDFPENKAMRHLLRIWLNTPKIAHTFPNFLGY